jgi:hypothetical protein
MAPKKKTKAPKKVVKKKPVTKQKPAAKKPAKPVSKPVSQKQAARKRNPPMHASVTHPELADDEEERDEVFEVFKSFDRDGSGSIDRAELARLLEALGQELPEVELEIALEVIDVNHSGRISWDEFKAWWSAR